MRRSPTTKQDAAQRAREVGEQSAKQESQLADAGAAQAAKLANQAEPLHGAPPRY